MLDIQNIEDLEYGKFTEAGTNQKSSIRVNVVKNVGFSSVDYDKIEIAKDDSYIKFYKNNILVKHLQFTTDSVNEIITEVNI